jgi:hypothetical protein
VCRLTETYINPDAGHDVDDVAILSTVRPLLAASNDISALLVWSCRGRQPVTVNVLYNLQ